MSDELKAKLDAHKASLDARMRRVEIIEKVEKIKNDQHVYKVDLEKKKIELDQLKNKEGGWTQPIDRLLHVAQAYIIDNEASVGTEPALRSLWDEEEMRFLKKLIIKKVKEL